MVTVRGTSNIPVVTRGGTAATNQLTVVRRKPAPPWVSGCPTRRSCFTRICDVGERDREATIDVNSPLPENSNSRLRRFQALLNLYRKGHPVDTGFEESLLRHHGHVVRSPLRTEWRPASAHLAWHGREVFKAQARQGLTTAPLFAKEILDMGRFQ